MMQLLRKRKSNHALDVKENQHEIAILEERISGLISQIDALRENRDEKILKFETTINQTQTNIDKLLGEVDEKTENVVEKTRLITDKNTTEDRLKQKTDLETQLERARKKAGLLNLRFHDLRHIAISRMWSYGMNALEISACSGHRDIKMLMRYSHYQLAYKIN